MNIMSKLFGLTDVGIDLGAAKMRVWVKGDGIVMDEPSSFSTNSIFFRSTARSNSIRSRPCSATKIRRNRRGFNLPW